MLNATSALSLAADRLARNYAAQEAADDDDEPLVTGVVDPENLPETPGALAAALTDSREIQRPHLQLIEDVLVEAAERGRQRIIVNIGPRYGKTRRVRWCCLHRLATKPDTRIIYTSYAKDLADEQTGWVRDQLERNDLGVSPRSDSRARDRWYLDGYEGGMLAAGIDSGITGFGADLLVIDDVVKNEQWANSPGRREAAWKFYTATAFDRLEPNASVVIVMTRWHEDDLTGRLLEQQPGTWTQIRIPTVAEDDDPLHRKPGELLWPERYDRPAVEEQQRTLGSHAFTARHQQRPTDSEGQIFRRGWLQHYRAVADGYDLGGSFLGDHFTRRFTTVDLAVSTKTSADYTVIATWAVSVKGELLLLDLVRRRMEGPDIVPALQAVHAKWQPAQIGVEATAFQLSIVQQAQRTGLPVTALRPDKDKISRAYTAAALAESKRLYLPEFAEWLADFEAELLAFPAGKHDDQVDVLSYAASEVQLGRWIGPNLPGNDGVVRYEGMEPDEYYDDELVPVM